MPPQESRILSARSYIILAITLAILSCVATLFTGAGSSIVQRLLGAPSNNSEDSIATLSAQVALQSTIIAQQNEIIKEPSATLTNPTLPKVPDGTPTNSTIFSTATPLPTPLPTSTQSSITNIKNTIDSILGNGNWTCLENYNNGISVLNLPDDILISSLWVAGDKYGVTYDLNEIMPGGGPATLWLTDPISVDNCPVPINYLTKTGIDQLIGANNWSCLNDYKNGINVKNVPSEFVVGIPWEAADKNGQKYNFGDIVPSGGPATFWLQSALAREECP